ncbi:MAG: DUF1573 domain-containing protein [Planctomycetes bacterium]|nr:DUF1573 domain-containing protein [Planctomycetota bacterium]MBM4009978.1 DUF1573 domain-containing protein [Planctomycetota bacterium]
MNLPRTTLVAVCLAVVSAAPAVAQDWAKKMFTETSHNFGTVARGAKTEHRFVFANTYKEDVHVVSVRSSCGCTSPKVSRHDLKTGESAEIIATFNTHSFVGQRGATLTVTFDKPFYAEVQLRVSGNIRGDVAFTPAFVDLGKVPFGSGAEQKVRVSRSGDFPWVIQDVRSVNSNFEVMLSKPQRSGGQSSYDLTFRLKPGAPAGFLKGQLILVTNDPRATQIPMDVEGLIVAPVTVSPQLLAMGAVPCGGTVTKNVVVKADRPFKVTGIDCGDDCITCPAKPEPALVHILPVTFKAGDATGKIERELKIATDLGENVVPSVLVQATVEPAAEAPPANGAGPATSAAAAL